MVETSSLTSSSSSAMASIRTAIGGNSKTIGIVIVVLAAIAGIVYYLIKNDMIPGLTKFFQQSQGVINIKSP